LNSLVEAVKKEGRTPAVAAVVVGSWPSLAERIAAPLRFLAAADLPLRFLHPVKLIPYTALGGVLEALRGELRGPNLLDKGRGRPARSPVAATISLIVLLAALGVFSLAASLQLETKKVEAVEREIAIRAAEVKRIEAVKREVAALEKEIGAIEQFKTVRPRALNLLKELTEVLPADAWLARIRSTDTSVTIEGYAASATEILAKLEASPYFRKVEFISPTFRDARMKADRFAVKMEIEGLPKEEKHHETP
jgi:Tfp pilus assembly protein PilN